MMRMTVTTFNVLNGLYGWEGFRPYNFFLLPILAPGGHPANISPAHFRLLASFESDQIKWARLRCINIGDPHDAKKYGLISSFTTSEYGNEVETFEDLLYRYMQHPEAKSLGPDGQPCKGDTHGLLGRVHIVAARHRRIGKEHERRWEEGDDLESLAFVPVEYEMPGTKRKDTQLAPASERLIRMTKRIGIRRLVGFGLGRRILEKICRRDPVNAETLREYERQAREYKVKIRSKT
jgi:hypothetical protein